MDEELITEASDKLYHSNGNISISELPSYKGPYDKFVLWGVFAGTIFSVMINLRVFFIVFKLVSTRRIRTVSILLAHLSFVAICITLFIFQYIVNKWEVFDLCGKGICEFLSFLGNMFYGVFPLNVVCIIYERISSFKMSFENLRVWRTVCVMWAIAIFGCIPSLYMSEYEKDVITNVGKCKQILIFDDFGLTISYELFRLIVFHVLVVSYVVYALIRIRSKIRDLYLLKESLESVLSTRTLQKVHRIRFIYFHSIAFISLWLPAGLFVLLYKVLSRQGLPIGLIKALLTFVIFLTYAFIILTPFIYFLLHENISIAEFCFGERCSKNVVKLGGNRRRSSAICTTRGETINNSSVDIVRCNNVNVPVAIFHRTYAQVNNISPNAAVERVEQVKLNFGHKRRRKIHTNDRNLKVTCHNHDGGGSSSKHRLVSSSSLCSITSLSLHSTSSNLEFQRESEKIRRTVSLPTILNYDLENSRYAGQLK